MMSVAEKLFFQVCPPAIVAGQHSVQEFTTAAASDSDDWVTPLGANAPKGKVWLHIEATGNDVHIAFHSASGETMTTAKGLIVKAGDYGRDFYVDPVDHKFLYHYAGGAGTIKVQVSSKIGERRDI